ncbi:MAG: alpha-amylase family glycosyl hydrolase [Anaerolineaceae bacterium]
MKPIPNFQPPSWMSSLSHHPTSDYLSNPRPAFGETITVGLLAPADAPIRELILRTIPNGEQSFTRMHPGKVEGNMQFWEAEIAFRERFNPYRFGIVTKEAVWWLNAIGVSQTIPFNLFDFKLLTDQPKLDWLGQAIFYQIFPDRFDNGDPTNDPNGEAIPGTNIFRRTFPWREAYPYYPELIPFWGGDLKGVEDHLDYLEELGVNALYLNPIFLGWTNHRYDVVDFEHVDPVLGGDEALISLSDALKAKGMHYMLDIVPNHAGKGHPWFRSALANRTASEREFFFFHPDTEKPSTWMGFGNLIKLNYQSQALRDLMYRGDNSVMRRWLKPPYCADGWRVDVANMLGRHDDSQLDAEVLPEIRASVKAANPQAYLIGENFYEADAQLQGQAWDGVMNYTGFADPLLNWLRPYETGAIGWKGDIRAEERWESDSLVKSWMEHLAAIPWAIALQQFNVLDSHDTNRLRTILSGDEDLARLAAIAQFSFPGVPCLYYGDEIGLSDEAGFGSRNCMVWDEKDWNQDTLAFYRRLIALRKINEPLREGSFEILYWDLQLVCYQRVLAGRRIIVTLNRGPEEWSGRIIEVPTAGMKEKTRFDGYFSGRSITVEDARLTLPVLPKGGEIWLAGF